jgi:hypothetical protein
MALSLAKKIEEPTAEIFLLTEIILAKKIYLPK